MKIRAYKTTDRERVISLWNECGLVLCDPAKNEGIQRTTRKLGGVMQIKANLIALFLFVWVMVFTQESYAGDTFNLSACEKKAIDFYKSYRNILLAAQFNIKDVRKLVSKQILENIKTGKEDAYLANLRVTESKVLRILEYSARCEDNEIYLYLRTINFDEPYSFRVFKMREVDAGLVCSGQLFPDTLTG